jgi:hypothetical protein
MHLLTAVKGLSVRSCSAPPGRKQAEGQRDPAPSRNPQAIYAKAGTDHARRHESSRVRPDHVSCCIVHPPPSDRRSHTSVREQSCAPRSSSNRARAKDEVIPDRGSCVRFTSCVVSRSWLFEYVRIFNSVRTTRKATGVSEVAHVRCCSTRRKRSTRGRAAPPKRATTS